MNRNELPLAAFELHNGAVGNHRLRLLLFSLLFLLVLTLLLLRFAIVFIIFTDRGLFARYLCWLRCRWLDEDGY